MKRVYLDNNATAPLHPRVADALARALRTLHGNASSAHLEGRVARAMIEDARELIAELLDAEPQEVLFTSGGTEANNLALHGLLTLRRAFDAPLAVSAIEHPSVLEPARAWACRQLELIPVTADGVVDLEAAQTLAATPGSVLAVMMANNEVGTLQPVERIAAALAPQSLLHVDAVQAAGKLPISFHSLGASTLSLSAHKFHGPIGIGALLVRRELELVPLLRGGHQERGLRPGTEPAPLIHALAIALQVCLQDGQHREQITRLRDRLEQGLLAAWPQGCVHARNAPRVCNTTNICFRGLDGQQLLLALDARGVACSTGSACSSGAPGPSHVLLAMGVSEVDARASLRFSLGLLTTPEEVDLTIERFHDAVNAVRPPA